MDRAFSALLQESVRDLRSNIQQDIVREVNQSMAKTATHFSSSLQTQEREIGKSLQPVAAVPNELQRMNQRLEEVASIFQSAKGRGTFGELQLETLIRDAFPAGSFELQATLSNHKRVDCLLNLPSPIGKLAVDSKFPLDSFREQHSNINGLKNGEADGQRSKMQKESLRKHVHDIASKYIVPGETADCAILFLPSESLFMQVVENHTDVVLEAHRKKVWIACPTTLMAVLTTLQGVTRGMTLQQQTEQSLGHVQKMTQDIDRMLTRYEQAVKSVDKAKEDLRLMNVSVEKIRKSRDALDVQGLFLGNMNRSVKNGTKRRPAEKITEESNPVGMKDEDDAPDAVVDPILSDNEDAKKRAAHAIIS
jgi:DNA recombination protein RmuC